MELVGIINKFGGFYTIRGFAKLSDIAKVSEAEDFQRDLIPEHKQEIKEFYKKNKDLFFPEIVLSYTLKYDFNLEGAITALDPLTTILNKSEFISNVDKIKIRSLKTEVANQQVVKIIIDDDWVKTNKPFSRIDGNHRISAYLEPDEHSPFDEYMAPFCIILLSDTSESNKSKKVVFHNINSKARVLTSEEELKSIISNNDFSDDELKEKFGSEYYAIRQIFKDMPNNLGEVYPYLGQEFINQPRTFCKYLAKLLIENEENNESYDFSKVKGALKKVNHIFGNYDELKTNKDISIVIAAVYLLISETGDINLFIKWLLKNYINDLERLDPLSLIEIYKKIRESKEKQIFVSMQFDNNTKVHYDVIKRIVNKINIDFSLDIKLSEIRIDEFNRGHSYKIDDEILKLIEESGLLIVDLTAKNVNVYQELGYLMGLNQGKGLKQENFILIKKQDKDSSEGDVGFNIRPFQQLRFENTEDLAKKLEFALKKYYQL